MKKKIIAFTSIIILLFIICIIIYNVNSVIFLKKSNGLECFKFKVGNVALQIYYPDEFINMSYADSVRISRRDEHNISKSADENYILTIDAAYDLKASDPGIIDQIIANTLLEPGPQYKKSTFNGYEAGFVREKSDTGLFDEYVIPVGSAVFYLGYEISNNFSKEDRVLAEKMLQSISFMQTNEDIKEPRVEKCE